MPQVPLEKEIGWREKLTTHSVFFLSALLFHLLLFLIVAGWIVIRGTSAPPDQAEFQQAPPQTEVTPPTPPKQIDVSVKVPTPPNSSPDIPITGSSPNFSINIPMYGNTSFTGLFSPPETPVKRVNDFNKDRIPKIQHMNDLRGRTLGQIATNDPSCTFPVYVASYANGDWACNTRLDKDGNIVAGSIPDLVAKISEWSHGKVKGYVVPKPLNIASAELLDKMPPFIFFTGHKDFVLTQEEVDNLRQYLNDGGAIWGDNALAGEGSRFDVAFHREMKRVIPDKDKNFVPYSVNDQIFTEGRYPLHEFPTGMNYYAEPPQHLDIDGILAILYTPNDYSDLMFMKINQDDASFFMTYKPIPEGTLFTNTAFVEKRAIFYRNFDVKSSLAVQRMGMDIVTHLIIRFDAQLIFAH